MNWKICLAVFLCAATEVFAQPVYKHVDAAGRTIYANQSDTLAPPLRTATISALDVSNALASNTAISSRIAATIDGNEATRRLEKAQLERTQGTEPLPGEQDRSAGTGVVKHRYWQRQEKLRRAVEQAQLRSHRARR
jgi:hypothetical protein